MDQQVGRYKIVGKLGKGAMGMVFLAEDPLLHRQVALKTIDLSVDDPSQRDFLHDRLLRDARAAAALSHPHIVGVFDVVEEGETAWLVMEYITGETLAQRMAAGPVDPAFALHLLAEVAAALDYTHARGVIHRDIKPANIMIDAQGAAKIMDFGIARLAQGRTTTPTGMVMGTIEYMAPEQIKGEAVDGRADQFALAAVAYQVLTGSTLFGPQSLTTLTYKLVHEAPPPARARNPHLPPGVDQVLSRALSKAPADRFVNCAGFVAALQAALAGNATAAMPTERTPVEASTGRNWAGPAIAAGIVVVGLLAFGAVLLVKRQHVASPPVADAAQSPGALPTAPPGPSPAPPKDPPPAAEPPVKTASVPVEPPMVEPHPPEAQPPVPDEGGPALDEARSKIQARDFAGAGDLLSKVIATHPRSAQAHELRGLAFQEQKLFENAIQDYTATLRLVPDHVGALHQRGICYVQLKDDDDALKDFDRVLKKQPDLGAAYINRGFLFHRRQEFDKAIQDFSQAIILMPKNANAYRGRMIARRESGDHKGAAQDEQKFNELRSR